MSRVRNGNSSRQRRIGNDAFCFRAALRRCSSILFVASALDYLFSFCRGFFLFLGWFSFRLKTIWRWIRRKKRTKMKRDRKKYWHVFSSRTQTCNAKQSKPHNSFRCWFFHFHSDVFPPLCRICCRQTLSFEFDFRQSLESFVRSFVRFRNHRGPEPLLKRRKRASPAHIVSKPLECCHATITLFIPLSIFSRLVCRFPLTRMKNDSNAKREI